MRRRTQDPIDQLIAANAATYRPGMDRPDPAILARLEAQRWQRILLAEARLHARKVQAQAAQVAQA